MGYDLFFHPIYSLDLDFAERRLDPTIKSPKQTTILKAPITCYVEGVKKLEKGWTTDLLTHPRNNNWCVWTYFLVVYSLLENKLNIYTSWQIPYERVVMDRCPISLNTALNMLLIIEHIYTYLHNCNRGEKSVTNSGNELISEWITGLTSLCNNKFFKSCTEYFGRKLEK